MVSPPTPAAGQEALQGPDAPDASSHSNVGAFFEEGMWLRYNFQASGLGARESGGRSESSPDPAAPDLAREEIHLSFSTTKAPCILLYVSSLTPDFLAVLVKPTGSLQVRYNLGGTREPYNIDVDHRNMANGQPHSVNITRHEKTVILKERAVLNSQLLEKWSLPQQIQIPVASTRVEPFASMRKKTSIEMPDLCLLLRTEQEGVTATDTGD
ncbi:hypothetical protein CB1_000993055 [Camelus ferus]|nr:hypothetical protein CB1_000993055 [Camelus ferus]